VSTRSGGGPGGNPGGDVPQNIATAIADISERATLLVREEIELAKAEVAEKASKLIRGAIVGAVAGVFVLMALFFALFGVAWLLYYYLPIGNDYTYFWGFFALALILFVLGVIAGLVAARAVKRGAPPVPDMALEEARLIADTVSHTPETPHAPPAPVSGFAAPAPYGAAAPAGTVAPASPTAQPVAPAGAGTAQPAADAAQQPSTSDDPDAHAAPADDPSSPKSDQEAGN
jgi:uncharacterized membrane protein YqjE